MDWTFTEEEFSAFMDQQYENYRQFDRVIEDCGVWQKESNLTMFEHSGDELPFQIESPTLKVRGGVVYNPFRYAA